MSTLDKIINRVKRGSVDDDDTNYVTVVDRPPATYSYQKKTIPSRYTNDFERIYQVVKSSYNCGTVKYNYDACIYDNLVRNYVQKGVADVSSIQGYSNVSLQDLPLACNIPSVVYETCSPPTNMLIEPEIRVTDTTAGFRINVKGKYLQSSRDGLVLLRTNEIGFTLENTRFLVENNKLKNFITNKFVSYNTTTRTLELVSQTNWTLRYNILNFNFMKIEFTNKILNLNSGVIYDVCLIEEYTNRLQSYVTSIDSVKILSNQNSDVVSYNFDTIIVYGENNPFRYLGYNVENRLYLNQNFNTYSNIYVSGSSSSQISLINCSSNGNWIGVSYTNSISNGKSLFILLNKNNINQSFYGNDFGTNINQQTRIIDFAISDDGNIVYILTNVPETLNYEIYQIYSKSIINKIYTINNYASRGTIKMKISFSGKNIIIYSENNKSIYLSLDYGKTFNLLSYSSFSSSAYCFNDEIYLSNSLGLLQIINNEFIPIITSNINGDFILIGITNKYFIFGIYSNKIDIFVTDKKKKFNMYVTTEDNRNNIRSMYVNNTCSRYIKVDTNTESLSNYNLNIPSIYQDTPYILKNGPCYPSYSFTISTILNEGVKNVFNNDTFVLSSDTTIIKKISNNLSITSSSILRGIDTLITIPPNSGSIRDIACSNNGNFIISAVYNGKLLVSTDAGSSFTAYNEVGQFKDVSRNSITNITRYWISVDCSFNGKYMSACAYNGNIFISTNSGTLFTSSSSNFAKKWVQIVMNKNSDDTKDGIIQFACAEDGLFISYDRGANWSQIRNKVIASALINNLKWSSVAISDSGQYMLATVYGGNVYASYNYGYDWTIYGLSRKECYEPVVYPNTLNNRYIGYTVSASSTLSGSNIINAFIDDSSFWYPSNNNSNVIINFPLNYKFLLTEIQIVNILTDKEIRIKVEGSNDGSNWYTIGDNLNPYSIVNTNTSYNSFKLTFSSLSLPFSSSNLLIQRIKLIGKTEFNNAGVMSERRNWKSCAIVSETQHYATIDTGSDVGLYKSVLFIGTGLSIFKPIFNSVVSTQNLDWNNDFPILSNNSNKLMIFINKNFNTQVDLRKINIGIARPANDGGMMFLYDDDTIDNSSTKLVPRFSNFDYITFINDNIENIQKFIWTLSYIDDNTFTIQNINTGRFLKAFNYYESTYVYVGDNSSLDFNTRLWFLQRD